MGRVNSEDRYHGLLGAGVLAAWIEVDGNNQRELNNWYTHEHLPERVGIPGFLRARRYVSTDRVASGGEVKYFALYETESVDTLASPRYLARLNSPTEWTKRVVPLFKTEVRTVCKVTCTVGQGIGGQIATIEFGPLKARESALRDWLRTEALSEAVGSRPEIVGAHLFEADEATTKAKETTEEAKSDGPQGPMARWVVMVEGLFDADVQAVSADLLAGLKAHGSSADVALSRYRLLFGITR